MDQLSLPKDRSNVPKGQRQTRLENERIYGQPLPRISEKSWKTYLFSIFGLFSAGKTDELVMGVLDPLTRSVWVYNEDDQMLLWRRGFFGKGNLSRSEPTWLKREINRLQIQKQGGKGRYSTDKALQAIFLWFSELTAEEITARRRIIRKQFKQERAEAVAAAEAEAEASFAANPDVAPVITTVIPSTQTSGLQKRLQTIISESDVQTLPELSADEIPENVEHLQLSLQEAFFLAWAVGCLTIRNSDDGEPIPILGFWRMCLNYFSPSISMHRADNPFLVQYVAYHHFRSLGWVVKSGIKFCVDYLLYKRGPVFHHAEFAVVIIPSYTVPSDRDSSPYNLPNSGPVSWQWFSTLNRANAQVMKVGSRVDTYVCWRLMCTIDSCVGICNYPSDKEYNYAKIR